MWIIANDDCLNTLKTMPDNSIDSVVTDPPYELGFMGKKWDASGIAYSVDLWAEALRVLKPGGHLLAFGGTRTYHRMVCAIEDAGFEIRDSLHWIYGSGFPKSLDVSKAIDKAAGAERKVVGRSKYADKGRTLTNKVYSQATASDQEVVTAPATDDAKEYEGWGTALKPAHEPIVMARKPLDARPLITVTEGIKTNNTVAANVLEHGTGALNIDACRVGSESRPLIKPNRRKLAGCDTYEGSIDGSFTGSQYAGETSKGRWPPNILLSHSPYCVNIRLKRSEDPGAWDCSESCPVAEMDRQSGILKSGGFNGVIQKARTNDSKGAELERVREDRAPDTGGASRFFPEFEWDDLAREYFRYQAKASKSERPVVDGVAHPTVKPLALIRWLVRLVTPVGGTVLDMFAGTGPVAEACELEGFDSVLIERESDYIKLINARMAKYESRAA